jgi:ferric-dicitrate binding protein FerR (iron transport regulator)
MSKYISFQTDDFVLDEQFRSWVMHPTPEKDVFWYDFLASYPQQRKAVEEARILVQGLQVNWIPVSEEQARQSYQKLENRIFQRKSIPLWQQPALRYGVAAAVTLLLIAFAAWFALVGISSETSYQTAFGEIKNITLPDGSVVTLNANSKLTLPKKWESHASREVWLSGEAFFDVKHLNTHQKFLVHTSDDFAVEVLGTSFNVFKRESGTRVVLQSGKVKLNIGHADEEDIIMQPGEQVEIEPATGTYHRKRVNPKIASAWTSRKLIFDNTPLSDIIPLLEETYGLQVEVSHPELLNKRVFGSCPTDDIDVLLAAISRPFGLSVKRNGKQVYISSS